ncbi:MAG: Rpn family recombination-promoting nuclease/putative transposase [Azoarcus sp.]|nr:Rpn family recombination-promoting nuclease/putative transposase [Azoarcus sp.]
MTKPFLSPRNDAVFKMLFGDARDTSLLIGFLKSTLTLPAEDYTDVTIIDPHSPRDVPDDKQGILDVKIKTASGKRINVEIQIVNHADLRERILFYLARMVTEQIGEGEDYQNIRRSICILITDHVQISENRVYHNRYRLRDAETGSEFTDLVEINTLELPKLPCETDGTVLWNWLKFLDVRRKEELTMLTQDPQIGKAVAKLMALSEDEEARMLAESREKLRRDISAAEHAARKEGLERGREEGREEGRGKAQLAIARKALEKGLAVETVAAITGLSQSDILLLQSEEGIGH